MYLQVQLWNLSRGFPIRQNDRNIGTFWYLRHLRSPGQFENVKDLICDFLKFKEIEGKIVPDTLLSLPYTVQHPQDTPRYPQTLI